MSISVMAAVWDSDVKTGRFVLLALADNATDGGYCMPGVLYLAGKTGLSRATVFRALEALEANHFIERKARCRTNGSRRSNAYRINLELLAQHRRAGLAEEASELAKLFNDGDVSAAPPSQSETGGLDLDPSPPSQTETGVVSERDGGGLTVRPLEPSVEPSLEPQSSKPFAALGVDHERAVVVAAPEQPRKRGCRIPDDFAVTPAMVAWAREQTPNVDGRFETEQFVDYWQAKTRDNTKLDWVATWRRWMRDAEQRSARRPSRNTRSGIDLSIAGFEAMKDGPGPSQDQLALPTQPLRHQGAHP